MDSASSKGFDFASDDILCSYEDYTNPDNSNGTHSDSPIATNSSKEFNKSRMSRASMPASSYSQPVDQDVVIAAVERSMKKHSENVMRFLEGLSSRLSQLELYCYNVDKSIGEMRSDLARDNGEADAKLKFLEKNLQEVHRSVQIIRDKQELADTQKELAKLQLAQKESSSGHDSQKSEETSSTPSSDHNTKRTESLADGQHGQQQQLALVLPHQLTPMSQPQPPTQPQTQTYYLSPAQLPNMPPTTQVPQNHYHQSDPPHYPTPTPPRPQSQQVNPQYHQSQPQVNSQYQPTARPSFPQPYLQNQPQVNPSNPEPVSMPYLQSPQVNPSSPGLTYPFNRTNQPPPPQHLKPGEGYSPVGAHLNNNNSNNNSYMMYENPSHFPQSVYPPNPQQTSGGSGGNMMVRPPAQFMRNHPYNELIDKLGSMGYRGEHVMSVIQRLEESGQTVDFNTVLDRLNGSGPRGWSG